MWGARIWIAAILLALGGFVCWTCFGARLGLDRRAISGLPLTPLRSSPAPGAVDLSDWATEVPEFGSVGAAPRRIKRKCDGAAMMLVPPGTFRMGQLPGDSLGEPEERPQIEVRINQWYYMDVHEITKGRFRTFVEETRYKTTAEQGKHLGSIAHGPGGRRYADRSDWRASLLGEWGLDADRLPVIYVTWDDAMAYAGWAGCDLPTEAEFERAMRGGRTNEVWYWSETGRGPWLWANAGGTHDGFKCRSPVGWFGCNRYGLHDLAGNVAEWCVNGPAAGYLAPYDRDSAVDPGSGIGNARRYIRGGDWRWGVEWLRSSARLDGNRRLASMDLGFRLVKRIGP